MITIWHNPRCSKSRQTLAMVEAKGEVTVRRYLEDAPTLQELVEVQALLGVPVIDMMRPKEALFKELGLSKSDDEATLLAAMAENPKLIERPIVLANDKAALGRPPEAVLDIL
ncbi:MAG: arsenate reductase (glutaredoxin) [Shimia sp.]|uniref:arsenate reductase (glutaredoxin) n=1 Tax=Shimia sp. TaxID=1954381 RepID=UPI0019E89962|nr:arsenate reductase (glutaredoxin) [Shimia sp.]MBE1292836.1 arsenate reductase (glutaredoxin) [Paracoccaceae bacterium]MBO6898155.1 arsenate reductase (glutaredoxin) [Shimia sp.]